MTWINQLWGWAQSVGAPPAALPPFVPGPTIEPAALRQEQFADHHHAVAAHTERQMMILDRICTNRPLSAADEAFIAETLDVKFVEPKK